MYARDKPQLTQCNICIEANAKYRPRKFKAFVNENYYVFQMQHNFVKLILSKDTCISILISSTNLDLI